MQIKFHGPRLWNMQREVFPLRSAGGTHSYSGPLFFSHITYKYSTSPGTIDHKYKHHISGFCIYNNTTTLPAFRPRRFSRLYPHNIRSTSHHALRLLHQTQPISTETASYFSPAAPDLPIGRALRSERKEAVLLLD